MLEICKSVFTLFQQDFYFLYVINFGLENQLFCKISCWLNVGFLQMCWWVLAKKRLEKRINFSLGNIFFVFIILVFKLCLVLYAFLASIAYNGLGLAEGGVLALKFNRRTEVEPCINAQSKNFSPAFGKPLLADVYFFNSYFLSVNYKCKILFSVFG